MGIRKINLCLFSCIFFSEMILTINIQKVLYFFYKLFFHHKQFFMINWKFKILFLELEMFNSYKNSFLVTSEQSATQSGHDPFKNMRK